MPLRIFISYSHRDEPVLERMKAHFAMLERDGLVEAWTDKEIRAGDQIDNEVFAAHDASTVFIPIVSPDFLASSYCYDKEMQTALNKAAEGKMTIFPVIAEPCEWLASPLKKFKAVPKDGKPISEWANANNAYLDVVRELRRLASDTSRSPAPLSSLRKVSTQPRLKIQRDFSSIDKSRFRDTAFQEIRKYFLDSIEEIGTIEGLQGGFDDIDATAFTCTLVNRAKRNGESHLTVRNNKAGERYTLGDITCSFDAHARAGSANEIIQVSYDEYDLFLQLGIGTFASDERNQRLSAAQVADSLWRDFVRRAGIDFE